MHKMNIICANCAGLGQTHIWEPADKDTLQMKINVCEHCNGKGYTEYSVFTAEEAEVILKHCGLSTESE